MRKETYREATGNLHKHPKQSLAGFPRNERDPNQFCPPTNQKGPRRAHGGKPGGFRIPGGKTKGKYVPKKNGGGGQVVRRQNNTRGRKEGDTPYTKEECKVRGLPEGKAPGGLGRKEWAGDDRREKGLSRKHPGGGGGTLFKRGGGQGEVWTTNIQIMKKDGQNKTRSAVQKSKHGQWADPHRGEGKVPERGQGPEPKTGTPNSKAPPRFTKPRMFNTD